jgi:K+-sensing histidine kinase KdpD
MNLKAVINSFLNERPDLRYYHYLLSAIIISGVAYLSIPLATTQNYHLVSFILLFVVSILSTFMGIGPVLLASTYGALVWNFFFIPPHHTFHIEKTEDILIFGLFFIIALVNGVLTTKVRKQEKVAREREQRTSSLFQLTKELSRAIGIVEVLSVAVEEINTHFSVNSFFILQDGNNMLDTTSINNLDMKFTPVDISAAEWVFKNMMTAGKYTENHLSSVYTFFPLTGTRMNPGVIAIKCEKPFPAENKSYWDTFLAQISNALEREFLGELAQKVRFLDESDRLYKTLFNSISHEFRIPVATIMGASDNIINSASSEDVRMELCNEIFSASLRLNRLVENLLNISRLESGHITVRLDWYDINDLVNKVVEDLKDELKSFTLRVSIPAEMPLVRIDFGLMEQVLYNLIFNSVQYSPDASVIELKSFYENGEITIEISDSGPGFLEKDLPNVFRKFFRVDGSKTGGLGLGLSIVKGFIEAHNGQIAVGNRNSGGARFIIKIPSEKPEIVDL